MFTSSTLVNCG